MKGAGAGAGFGARSAPLRQAPLSPPPQGSPVVLCRRENVPAGWRGREVGGVPFGNTETAELPTWLELGAPFGLGERPSHASVAAQAEGGGGPGPGQAPILRVPLCLLQVLQMQGSVDWSEEKGQWHVSGRGGGSSSLCFGPSISWAVLEEEEEK